MPIPSQLQKSCFVVREFHVKDSSIFARPSSNWRKKFSYFQQRNSIFFVDIQSVSQLTRMKTIPETIWIVSWFTTIQLRDQDIDHKLSYGILSNSSKARRVYSSSSFAEKRHIFVYKTDFIHVRSFKQNLRENTEHIRLFPCFIYLRCWFTCLWNLWTAKS